MTHYVYILASRPGGALYVGRTSNLRTRLSAHTARYNIHTLVWFEPHEDFETALRRERSLKRWHRAWKDALIVGVNPGWRDISGQIDL